MRDAVVVVPIFVTGAFMLVGVADSPHRSYGHLTEYLMFLGLLFGLLFAWWRIKLKSAERFRALELGRPTVADAASGWTPVRACAVIGLGVPLGLFAIAWLASLSARPETSAIWTAAAAVGVTVPVCCTYLLTRLPASAFHAHGASSGSSNGLHTAKPEAYDPDAFDVVGRRG